VLGGVDAPARHLGESVDRLVMLTEERRHLLIELAEVLLDQLQSSSVSVSSRRYTGWRSAHASTALRNWSDVARKRESASAANVAGSVSSGWTRNRWRRAVRGDALPRRQAESHERARSCEWLTSLDNFRNWLGLGPSASESG
jgi:hypothetical protein